MRIALSLSAGLLLTAVLSGCADDAEPTAGGTATPRATSSPRATASAPATPTPTPTTTTATASPTPPTSPPAVPAPTGTPASSTRPAVSPAAEQVRLTGDGIDLGPRVVSFGAPYEQARPGLDAALGRPTTDTGVVESFGPYGTCPGTRLRALEYGGGALVVLFGDVAGPGLTMYQWGLTTQGTPSQVPRASALVGDAATYAFGVGTRVADLRQGARPATVEVDPGDEALPASFRVQDQSSGLFGYLTGPAPGDTATFVQGGQGCGE